MNITTTGHLIPVRGETDFTNTTSSGLWCVIFDRSWNRFAPHLFNATKGKEPQGRVRPEGWLDKVHNKLRFQLRIPNSQMEFVHWQRDHVERGSSVQVPSEALVVGPLTRDTEQTICIVRRILAEWELGLQHLKLDVVDSRPLDLAQEPARWPRWQPPLKRSAEMDKYILYVIIHKEHATADAPLLADANITVDKSAISMKQVIRRMTALPFNKDVGIFSVNWKSATPPSNEAVVVGPFRGNPAPALEAIYHELLNMFMHLNLSVSIS